MRTRGDTGETLVEILLTVMIIGLTVTALISSLADGEQRRQCPTNQRSR